MLLGFYVSNWKSIREPVEFTMEATREQQHGERLTRINKFQRRVLPAAVLFGGNASGKSSFVEALQFMRSFIVEWEDGFLKTNLKPFAFDPKYNDKPSSFEVDLLINDFIYNYRFTCDRNQVYEEKLSRTNSKKELVIFHRQNGKILQWDETMAAKDRLRLEIIFEGTKENKLFLTNSVDQNMDTFRVIYNWFLSSLVIIHPETHFSRLRIFDSEEVLNLYNTWLPLMDTGIQRVERSPLKKSEVGINQDELKSILTVLNKDGETDGLLVLEDDFIFIKVSKDAEPSYYKMTSIHKDSAGAEAVLDIADESDGTKRLLDLIPAFCADQKQNDITFVIDEIDRSLHTLLTQELYRAFFARSEKGSRQQIIATTHDLELMTQDLFRRDEMWFFERKKSETKLVSVSEFAEGRNDKDLRKSYLEGRMGGLPKIRLESARMQTEVNV